MLEPALDVSVALTARWFGLQHKFVVFLESRLWPPTVATSVQSCAFHQAATKLEDRNFEEVWPWSRTHFQGSNTQLSFGNYIRT